MIVDHISKKISKFERLHRQFRWNIHEYVANHGYAAMVVQCKPAALQNYNYMYTFEDARIFNGIDKKAIPLTDHFHIVKSDLPNLAFDKLTPNDFCYILCIPKFYGENNEKGGLHILYTEFAFSAVIPLKGRIQYKNIQKLLDIRDMYNAGLIEKVR